MSSGTLPLKVMTVFGTRPEAVKMAPVVKALAANTGFNSVVVVTAQHREMLDQVLGLFHIAPHHDLNIMRHGQSLTDVTVRVMQGMERLYAQEKPDVVLVHGDTTTAMASTLAAFYQQIPVGHVEAGLRTFNSYDPFPEEMNRRLIDSMASMHFAPTATNRANLTRENVPPEHVFVTGNTVIEALRSVTGVNYQFEDPALQHITEMPGRLLLVTTHRRENLVAGRMQGIYAALRRILQSVPDVHIAFPVHKNPVVRKIVEDELGGLERIHLVEPASYGDFANLMQRSYLILTDSGGVQEEAPALGKPVLVLRETTERPEGVTAGTLRQVGTVEANIVAAACELLTEASAYEKMARATNPYGDGRAAQRIAEYLLYVYRGAEKPAAWETFC